MVVEVVSSGQGDFFGDGGGERSAELVELFDEDEDGRFGAEDFLLLLV